MVLQFLLLPRLATLLQLFLLTDDDNELNAAVIEYSLAAWILLDNPTESIVQQQELRAVFLSAMIYNQHLPPQMPFPIVFLLTEEVYSLHASGYNKWHTCNLTSSISYPVSRIVYK